ncbi:guanylate kinase [Bernardetia litoralis DSM 6794]|uniref:Guanylate kinase n=1 Tax=Bernardetia litoralis (strain ATCC 23117 / DSM 6794 / NBRC 15988 / NCIMB 1366 / Fx l1 / Sio-4) TaxID=880071 RepID=I4APH7_BERLS|nr:guanylate kinase [Bernardetia litoralis]AFM05862.1 guanylate kinase [Bernardetia litoralis DSM 6794]
MSQKLIIFSAPSGAGKTTIVKHLLSVYPKTLSFSISATTRSPRAYEKPSQDYYFISVEEFRKKIDNKAFIEYEQVYDGLYYGTLRSEVERLWSEGKVVVFDVDVKGGVALKQEFQEAALAVFVKPPSITELRKRLLSRQTETDETLKERVEKAEIEMEFAPFFDEVVINDSLSEALDYSEKIVEEFISKKPQHNHHQHHKNITL